MARTEVQAEVSKRNGKLSRGPVTKEGKRRSSMNAIRHGGLALVHAIPGESEEIYAAVERDLVATLHPRNPIEADLIRALAVDLVRQGRISEYMKTSEEVQVDDLRDGDKDLREELLRLRTALARWGRWKHMLSGFQYLDRHRMLEVLDELVNLLESLPAEEDPISPNSAYHDLEWLRTSVRVVQESWFSVDRIKGERVATRIAETHTVTLEAHVEDLAERISYRSKLRERMARAIPDEETLKLVSRYQATVDNALTRRLGMLKELRSLSKGSSEGAE